MEHIMFVVKKCANKAINGRNTDAQVESVGGRNMVFGLCLFRNKILWCIGEAERLKGSAPYNSEVVVAFYRNYTRMIPAGFFPGLI